MFRRRAVAAIIAASFAFAATAHASSHREAPLITQTPKLDGTDLYLFRSYETGRSDFVTMIANFQPFQDPYGGPNYFTMDPQAVYDINIDNLGSGRPSMIFRFRFTNSDKALSLNIGGVEVPVALTELGSIAGPAPTTQNVVETFTISLVTKAGDDEYETPIRNLTNGGITFNKPVDNIGDKTIPNYAAYAGQFLYAIKIPGCPVQGRAFVGQRKESFVVNLGETFDLVNYTNPVGEQYANTTANSIGDKNITSLALEVPIACLVNGSDPVIGAWSTSSKVSFGFPFGPQLLTQASRLGNPLVNELVIGLPDKDKFNASTPAGDAQFANYVTHPTFPTILQLLFGTAAPTAYPRQDLVAVFLTGVTGLNAPKHLLRAGEEMRLNTSITPVATGSQNRLGVIAGDNAGYPNGRRPGDDVVDISLRVVMGRLYTLGLFGKPTDAPSGGLDFTDGAYIDSTFFSAAFPYLLPPIPGSPASAFFGASTNLPPGSSITPPPSN